MTSCICFHKDRGIRLDLRVRKTYSALIAACTDLMSGMRFEDITVAMLCDRAMIRRTTFYKHFADKSEFFSFYVDSLRGDMVERGRLAIDELEPGVAHTAFAERAAILDAMADYFLEHETLMDNIFSSSTCGMMLVVICEKMAQSFNEKAAHDLRIEAPGPDDLICRCEFAAGGIIRLLLLWWDQEDRRSGKDEFVRTCNQLAERLLGK